MMKQKANGKIFIAFLLSAAIVVSMCVPTSAKEVGNSGTADSGACELTEGCVLENGHEGDCEVPSEDAQTTGESADDKNTPGEGDGTDQEDNSGQPTDAEDNADQPTDGADAPTEENKGGSIVVDGVHIYPGGEETQDGKKVWVAYDAEYSTSQPADATIRATVTLPDDVTVPSGYKLFIYKVKEGEGFYPKAAAVEERASKYNEYQCYTIRWVNPDTPDPTADTLDTKSMSQILGDKDSKNVTIKIDYLKDEAKLEGPAGARKLLIFNSTKEGDLLDTVSDSVTDVKVTDTHYNSFTFNTHQAGPYVFVSKHIEKGYISKLAIESIEDGFEPFDSDSEPGNDENNNNGIVRSYDTIQYHLAATFAGRQNQTTAESVNMYFELSIKKSATAARFDTAKMLWLKDNYGIEYLDDKGDVVMIQTHKGQFCEPKRDAEGNVVRDKHGFAQANESKEVSFNAQLNGSESGQDSYKVSTGGIVEQRLTGWTTVGEKGENILNSTKTFSAAVEVRNADNGEVFQPSFKMWLEGNEENYGKEGGDGNQMQPAQPCMDNYVPSEEVKKITVSAGTNFNLQLKKNVDMSYKNWFDFSTGDAVVKDIQTRLDELARLEDNRGKSNPAEFVDERGAALDETTKKAYENYRYGRITCYGITLQLYNDTNNNPDTNRAAKGLKGLSLPVGDIEFDVNFSSTVLSGGVGFPGSDTEYPAILWDYNENIPANNSYKYTYKDPGRGEVAPPSDGKGNGKRRLFWDGEERSPYAKGAAPSNYRFYHDGCYYGGDWALMNGNTKVNSLEDLSKVAHPNIVTGTGGDTNYHFSVSDYDFDFDDHLFPLKDAGNSGNVTGYDTFARCFSAGCVQVLSVFPRVQKEDTATINLTATVNNLELKTRAGQELRAETGDNTKYQHEVNKKDNTKTDKIVVYAPGNLTKGSAFNGLHKGKEPGAITEGFLGTDYWTTNYDCSAFAGDDIWIVSYGMMSAGSDYHTKSMNLLQIFDSRALKVRDEPKVFQSFAEGNNPGKVKFLFAADPDYPDGYDTNSEGVLAYMNTVREEDLVYSETMPDDKGYITVEGTSEKLKCIGVLMEIRSCDLLGGKYQYLRIPVKVNGDDETLVGKTVATVNTFRTWSYDIGEGITWSNGQWDGTTKKNVLENYPTPGQEDDLANYSGELENKGDIIYTKTEYKDGQQEPNSHSGGSLAGNSLLILGYKAHINIGVDNKSSESGSYIYNQENNETVVDYRLKNIKTEISNHTGQSQTPRTKLTIRTALDEGNSTGKDRISIAGDSYKMNEQAISSDSANPTSITFTASDNKEYTITVYAQPGATGRDITFVIDGAPVGLELPDITFQANFASIRNLENNAGIKTSTYISGTGDNRAYSTANGNEDNVTVNVVLSGGTNLDKAVKERYIELNGAISYDVIYTNGGSNEVQKVYFYDLMPFDGDIRDSGFSGDVILRSFDVRSSGDSQDAADATVYYSTTGYWELYETVNVFGGTGTSQEKVDAVEKMLNEGTNKDGDKLFEPLGSVENGEFVYEEELTKLAQDDPAKLTELLANITGLYVRAEKLKSKQTITLSFAIQTNGNQAGDFYRNISNSWIAGSETLPLKSVRVETAAVSRRISGVVWYDWNLNGIRDEGLEKEKPIKDAKVTLFKKNGSGTYEVCEKDITGQTIGVATTGDDGAYSFDKLAQGDYIVAFSGDALKPYTDATFYQRNGNNDSNTNDGKTSDELTAEGIDKNIYPYFIKYSNTAENMTLHSIDDIRSGSVALNNYKEDIDHQDLGVIAAGYELPETGGRGTTPYTAGGILLVMAAFLIYGFTDRRRQYR